MNIYRSVGELVGKTPLLELSSYAAQRSLSARIIAKLEYFNPAGSAKDRAALEMINSAEREGKLKAGSTIIEPTSGNTGIGLASLAVSRGYRVIIVMPDNMSLERRTLMHAYGAELVLTDGALGMSEAIKKAEQLAVEIEDSWIPDQFSNRANAEAHKKTTGPEIWEDTDGAIDIFVACVGTGGTITGVGEYLKSKNKNIKIVAVEPSASPMLSKGFSGAHKIQGIGAGFVPEVLDTSIYDEIITVSDEDAMSAAREVAKSDGALVGISSGAALHAATELAKREENKDKNIVVFFSDSGERYISSGLFDN